MDQEAMTYPSAAKRLTVRICQPCIAGTHQQCATPGCPCPCNDDKRRAHPINWPSLTYPRLMAA